MPGKPRAELDWSWWPWTLFGFLFWSSTWVIIYCPLGTGRSWDLMHSQYWTPKCGIVCEHPKWYLHWHWPYSPFQILILVQAQYSFTALDPVFYDPKYGAVGYKTCPFYSLFWLYYIWLCTYNVVLLSLTFLYVWLPYSLRIETQS